MPSRFVVPSAAMAVVLTALFLPPTATAAVTCTDYTNSPRQVGAVDTPGSATDVATLGTWAYVADDSDLLQVVDVSDPSAPAIVAAVAVSGGASAVTVEGGYAYVVTTNGLQVLDLSSPALPVTQGLVATSAAGKDVVASGTAVYVALGTAGFDVIDASTPMTPVLVTTIPDTAEELDADGSRLATTAGWQHTARLYDTSAPLAPSLLGSVNWADPDPNMMRNFLAPVLSGDVLQFISWENYYDQQTFYYYDTSYLASVDFTNPFAPVWSSYAPIDEIGIGAVKDGNELYVLSRNTFYSTDSELWFFDNTNPLSAVPVHRLRVRSPAGGAAVAATPAGPAFLSCAASAGVRTFDVTHPEEPDWVGDLVRFGNTLDVTSLGNWVFASWYFHDFTDPGGGIPWGGVTSYDGSTPSSPASVGGFGQLDRYWNQLAAAADKLFALEWGTTTTIWRSTVDPVTGALAPEVAVTTPGASLQDLAATGSYLLAARGSGGIEVFDATPAGDPVSVFASATHPATSLGVDGAVGATLDSNTLRALDLTNPAAPAYGGSVATAVSGWVEVEGTLAIAGGGTTVEVFDLGDLASPTSLATIPFLDYVMAATVDGVVLYVTLAQGGLVAMDIVDPSSPQVLGALATDAAQGVTTHGGWVWVCEGGKLTPLPPACATVTVDAPVVSAGAPGLVVAPNPFRVGTSIRYSVAPGDRVGVRLYDVQGRLVRRLAEGRTGAGALGWDGRDESGRPVAPGIYFVRLESRQATETAKVVRVR